MSSRDLFKRGSLLPKGRRAPEAPGKGGLGPTKTTGEAGGSDEGVFDRETMVPPIAPEHLAREAMRHFDSSLVPPTRKATRDELPRDPGPVKPRDLAGRDERPTVKRTEEPDFDFGESDLEETSMSLDLTPLALEELSSIPARAAHTPLSLKRGSETESDPLGFVDGHNERTNPPPAPRTGVKSRSSSGARKSDDSFGDDSASSTNVSLSDLFAVGDFTGALAEAERRLELDPTNAAAKNYADKCREVLLKMYSSRIGPLERELKLVVPPDQIRWLSIDHRAGFVLSLVEESPTVEDVLDLCGMPRLEGMRIIVELLEKNVLRTEA